MTGQKYAKGHPSDEVIELYALGRLTESRAIPTEEHLLTCYDCQDRVADADAFASAMKEVCRTAIVSPRKNVLHFFDNLFTLPKPVDRKSVV